MYNREIKRRHFEINAKADKIIFLSIDRIIFSLARASFKSIDVLGIKLLEIYSCLFGTDDVRVGAYLSTYNRGGGCSLGRTATRERGGVVWA